MNNSSSTKHPENAELGKRHLLENFEEQLSDKAHKAGDQIADGYETAKVGIENASRQLRSFVTANPIVAVGVAGAVGWIVGRAIVTRSHHE